MAIYKVKQGLFSKISRQIHSFGSIKDVDIFLFTKHLSVVLKSGLTLIDGLEILRFEAKRSLKKIIDKFIEDLKNGSTFADTISNHPKNFSPVYISAVRSGESSGRLEENLAKLAEQLHKTISLKRKVRSAMIYPMLVFFAVFGLGITIALFVLPRIIPLFAALDTELPLLTKILLSAAQLFADHGTVILIGLIASIIVLIWILRREFVKPFTHRILLGIPVLKNVVKDINLERFTRTFGSLLQSGLTIDRCLTITAEAMENRVYRKAVKELRPAIEGGSKLVDIMSTYPDLFPIIATKMVDVGERTGSLETNLIYLSKFYEESIDETMKNLSVIIEPALLIFIGLIVGSVAMAILGPIYEIVGHIG